MTTLTDESVREPALIDFEKIPAPLRDGARRWLGRGQNFQIELIDAQAHAKPVEWSSDAETMLLLPDAGAVVTCGSMKADAPARSICILPAGVCSAAPAGTGKIIILSSQRTDLAGRSAINEADYARPDPRITPVGEAFRRVRNAGSIEVIAMDELRAPADNPRLKMLQSESIGINWVEYDGVRDRCKLSPHSHKSLEQGSLALEGDFVHHLRVEWRPDATQWRDDLHAYLPSPSLMVVPVNLIHTSEGVGDGHHLLIDVFSPPRRDFIAKGWVLNSQDYEAPD
jgi:hypothetical protein